MPGERIGIVGRTGSGKSSLFEVLYRMRRGVRGLVTIDGVDIEHVPRKILRSRIAIIPQVPVLFAGTVRENLDLEASATDDELWRVLEAVGIAEKIRMLPAGLDAMLYTDSTSNSNDKKAEEIGKQAVSLQLSVGERQLLCLARALLRRARIVCLDEATASVDVSTEALIRNLLLRPFASSAWLSGATVLMIAHRLESVMDCDRVLVMDRGRVAEFDSPQALLQRPNSAFSKLVAASRRQTRSGSLSASR